MKIFFEDKYLVVAYKEAGVPSQPDHSGKVDMTALLAEACKCEIFCVHRLDTATCGVMVYAKDSRTAGQLTASLSSDSAVKQYLCVVNGEDPGCGSMEDLLFHDKRKNKAYVVDRARKGVKKALLDYETLSTKDSLSLVRVTLCTGRTHQIRVQFASRKMPLVGDGKYGSRDNRSLALQCVRLAFLHPVTGKLINTEHLPDSPWYGFEIR